MEEYIAFDAHKRYTWVEREDVATGRTVHDRLEHAPGVIRRYLHRCLPATAGAVEATATSGYYCSCLILCENLPV